jgi:hypothetical protein
VEAAVPTLIVHGVFVRPGRTDEISPIPFLAS